MFIKKVAMIITPEEVNLILQDPYEAVNLTNLRYVSEGQLSILRKKHGRGFTYHKKGVRLADAETIERIKKLVIPPAWSEVKISHYQNSHLQVIGRDQKNRKQYMYHPMWSKIRNETKFFKMAAFGEALPKMRRRVERDLQLPDMKQRKVLALIIRLMEETHIRIGNQYYARENKTYGLSTFRNKHLKTYKNMVKFEFIGKKGKEHSITLKNKKLIKLINQCEEIPGWELFKFYDETGQKQSIDSGMVNEYIHEISGDKFSAKDFRTWSASKIFFETLNELGHNAEEKENKKNLLAALDTAATGLGNTRAVCRSYYVHPHIVKTYESGEILPYFNSVKKETKRNYTSLSET
ncbi:MAG TPA: hypothetical protein VLO29_08145, partial [Salegentibacter sp.]|nr:hypothetical protein [Salegentibacter sp.]